MPRWQIYLNAAETALDNGDLKKAKTNFEASLVLVRGERRKYKMGLVAHHDEMPEDVEARTSLALASLLGEMYLHPDTENRSRQQKAESFKKAEDAFNEAIGLAKSYSHLYFRARNEFAVFLLRAGRYRDAEGLFEAMRFETEMQDPVAVSRYEFNFGQLLMQSNRTAEAIDHYLAAFDADPSFRPAVDALFRAAGKAPAPALGIWAVWGLVAKSLDKLDAGGAAEYLRAGLERKEWWSAERFPSLLDLLVRFFLAVDLDAAGFQSDWAGIVKAIADSSAQGAAQRAKTIARAYEHNLRACLEDSQGAIPKYLPWSLSPEEASLFSEFLAMLADQRFKAGQFSFAVDRYLVATCLDPKAVKVSIHLANLLQQRPELWDVIRTGKTSPEIHASIGRGFGALGDNDSATKAFVHAAQASKSLLEINGYIDEAIKFSPEQKADLLQFGNELFANLDKMSDQIDVTDALAFTDRIQIAALLGVPNSHGIRTVASLVLPNAFASHLSLTDSQGSQANAVSFAGASPRNNVLSIDDVVVEGPPEPETSNSYYDVDALDSLDVMGGGADTSLGSNGLHVNFVTKNPGDKWSGSTSYLSLPGSVGKGDGSSGADFAPTQPVVETDRLRNNEEYSLQIGGPLKRERLWAWGSHGESEVGARALGGGRFETHLSDTAGKLNARLTSSDQLSFSFNHGNQQDHGLGAGLTRAPETTLDRTGKSEAWRLDYERNTPDWDVSVQYSRAEGDSSQRPRTAADAEMVLGPDGVWTGSFRRDRFQSRADQWQVSSTYEPRAPEAAWTLKAGGSLRQVESTAQSSFGHDNSLFIARENFDTDFDIARFYRSGRVGVSTTQAALWLQDTVRFRRLTFDLGLRYDLQEAENERSVTGANPVFPDLLPGVRTESGSGRISWESFSPRVGAIYYLRPNTSLRVSYARFASPIQFEYVQRVNSAAPSYLQFGFDDSNGNGVLDLHEHGSLRPLAPSGIDPARPRSGGPNVNDEGLEPEITREIILGFETGPANAKLDLSATWRRVSDVLELRTLIEDNGSIRPATREDFLRDGFVTVVLPDGRPSSAEIFTLNPRLAYTGGSLLTNGDREQEYFGLKLNIFTELGSRGRLRAVTAYERSNWDIGPAFRFFDDPTNVTQSVDPGGLLRADDNNDAVAVQAARAGTGDARNALASKWSANLNGSFELPFKLLLGTNVNFREGYALPYFAAVLAADGRERDVQVTRRADSFRLPDLYVVDLRLQRTFTVRSFSATFSLESFNLFNRNTPLRRIQQLNGPQSDFLAKTLSPRAVRLGVRLAWDS